MAVCARLLNEDFVGGIDGWEAYVCGMPNSNEYMAKLEELGMKKENIYKKLHRAW